MGKNTDIRGAVEAELAEGPLVDAADITVKNLNGDLAPPPTRRCRKWGQRRHRRRADHLGRVIGAGSSR
jgi:hypothetical protein